MTDFEKGLSIRINQRIGARGFCVVYDHELAQICAPDAALRAKQIRVIEEFAAKHGLAVQIREVGINATFKKKPQRDGRNHMKNGNGPTLRFANGNGPQ